MPGTSISDDISENEYNKEDLYASVTSYQEPQKDIVVSSKTGDILFTSKDPENYYISEEDNGIFYYYNHTLDDGYEYEELGKTQKTYYYDVKNKKMLEERPSFSPSVSDLELNLKEKNYGFKEYYISGKYGLMSGEKVIVPCEYDGIEFLDIDLFNYMKFQGKELVLLKKEKN